MTNCAAFSTTLHFARSRITGKERDSESGNDDFGARYYASSIGRFLSPDDFWNDSHAANPQSWNLYTYARNNPLRYNDPSGTTATQTYSCTTTNNQTTCNVTITATIAIYATEGSGITHDQLTQAASTITQSIDKAWSTTQPIQDSNGVTYNVNTNVTVTVADSQQQAEQSGAQNSIGLTNGVAYPGVMVNGEKVDGRSGVSESDGSGQDKGKWDIHTLSEDAGHEFTHLMGVDDHPEFAGIISTGIASLNSDSAKDRDYQWALHGVIGAVGTGVHNNYRAREFGHPTSPIGGKAIVGAPPPGGKWY